MAEGNASVAAWRFGRTMRRDLWWLQPALTALGLGAFVVYATWAAFQGAHYHFGPYLSPFYSPELFGDSPHAGSGRKPALVAGLAAVLAGAPDPVGSRRLPLHLLLLPRRLLQGVLGRPARPAPSASRARRYRGEQSFPLILQNVHRYFLYLALLVPAHPRATTSGRRCGSRTRDGRRAFGIGVGTLVLARQRRCCSAATRFGCHSLRHLVGGAQRRALEARRCARRPTTA